MFLRGPAALWILRREGSRLSQTKRSRKSRGLSPVHPAAAAIDIGAAMGRWCPLPGMDYRFLHSGRSTWAGPVQPCRYMRGSSAAAIKLLSDLVVRVKRLRPSTLRQAIEMTHAVTDSSV
jgi:hypothetical protein